MKVLAGLARSRIVRLERELAGSQDKRGSVITIGVFDGVHIGHKYLISRLKELAGQQGSRSVVITFHKHPQEVLAPLNQPPFLTDTAKKVALIREEGVDSVITLTFTKKLARLSAREFLFPLKTKLNMQRLVIGPDFAMGRNNEGDISALRKLGEEMEFSLTVVPPVVKNGEVVSSTAIRNALAEGDMDRVKLLMGRFFDLHGKVIHGKGRGTGLGFPTANLNVLPGQAVPVDGVYATLAYMTGKTFPSVTNVGMNPTFGNIERTIESYLFNMNEDLSGREIRIEFIQRLRGEIKFSDAEELTRQIQMDIRQAKETLKVEAMTKHG